MQTIEVVATDLAESYRRGIAEHLEAAAATVQWAFP